MLVNASFITGLGNVDSITVDSSGNLYVAEPAAYPNPGAVAKYSATGGLLDASLVPGIVGLTSLTLDGAGDLYVGGTAGVGEYTTGGGVINAQLISTPNVTSLAFLTPEPSVAALVTLAGGFGF